MEPWMNTGCIPRKVHQGLPFWAEWPLPAPGGPKGGGWAAGKVRIRPLCYRLVVLEGASHNGTTYDNLGTETVLGYRVETAPASPMAPPPGAEAVRPYWSRDSLLSQERGILPTEFLSAGAFPIFERDLDGKIVRSGVSGAPVVDTGEPAKDLVLRAAATKTFPVTGSSLFTALITGKMPSDIGSTTLNAVSAGGTSVKFARTATPPTTVYPLKPRYDANGVTEWSPDESVFRAHLRFSGDPGNGVHEVVFTPDMDGSTPVYVGYLVDPAPFAISSGSSFTVHGRAPIPPHIKHDVYLRCLTYVRLKYGEVDGDTIYETNSFYPELLDHDCFGIYGGMVDTIAEVPPEATNVTTVDGPTEYWWLQEYPSCGALLAPPGDSIPAPGEDWTYEAVHPRWYTYTPPEPGIVSRELGGTLITPSIFYSRCEPGTYYAS